MTFFFTVQCSNLFYRLFYIVNPASLSLLFSLFFSSMFAFTSFCLIPTVNQLCFITLLFQVCSVFLVILWYILWSDYYDNVMVLTLYLCPSIFFPVFFFCIFCLSVSLLCMFFAYYYTPLLFGILKDEFLKIQGLCVMTVMSEFLLFHSNSSSCFIFAFDRSINVDPKYSLAYCIAFPYSLISSSFICISKICIFADSDTIYRILSVHFSAHYSNRSIKITIVKVAGKIKANYLHRLLILRKL